MYTHGNVHRNITFCPDLPRTDSHSGQIWAELQYSASVNFCPDSGQIWAESHIFKQGTAVHGNTNSAQICPELPRFCPDLGRIGKTFCPDLPRTVQTFWPDQIWPELFPSSGQIWPEWFSTSGQIWAERKNLGGFAHDLAE